MHDLWKPVSVFMDRLILRNEDVFMAREPERALGGVRGSMHSSFIRIDFVSHTLAAFLKRCESGTRAQ